MRTPKIKALAQIIRWLNHYVIINQHSKLPRTKNILSEIQEICNLNNQYLKFPLIIKELDSSPIYSNA
jgi:hypothetical protein